MPARSSPLIPTTPGQLADIAPSSSPAGRLRPPASPWQRGSNENTYWCRLGGPDFFDGRGSVGPLGDSENTCRKAFR
ncbi:hypothetical protein GCM10010420_52650 [Streptomyces glaucosporus]|uniref:Uncharacterized protein n=1 Tax=Streptomyces glaucosporus TaxID=284044 RepID=A0ABP5VZI2_9ACTN